MIDDSFADLKTQGFIKTQGNFGAKLKGPEVLLKIFIKKTYVHIKNLVQVSLSLKNSSNFLLKRKICTKKTQDFRIFPPKLKYFCQNSRIFAKTQGFFLKTQQKRSKNSRYRRFQPPVTPGISSKKKPGLIPPPFKVNRYVFP